MISFVKETFMPSMERLKPRNVSSAILANHTAGSFLFLIAPTLLSYGVPILITCAFIGIIWFWVVVLQQYRNHIPKMDMAYDAFAFVQGLWFAGAIWSNDLPHAITATLLTIITAQSAFSIAKNKNEVNND